MDATTLAQITGVLRVLLPAGLAFAVGKGWLSATDSTTLSSALLAAAPTAVALGAAVWSVVAHSKTATIAAVAAMPEVKAVVAAPSVANSSTFVDNSKVLTQEQANAKLSSS